MSFLTAEWRKLAIANYTVDPKVLEKYVPANTELDLWQGNCYVSLVGFMFLNTKLLGFSIPGHRNFEEVNLRFYVRYNEEGKWKRGVVFIKEIVPKPALTAVANTVYREHYETNKMSHFWGEDKEQRIVRYTWDNKKVISSFEVVADTLPSKIEPGSEEEFITEHYWGYTKVNDRKTYEYEVTHPTWEVYDVKDSSVLLDFGKVYGEDFAFLTGTEPKSVMLAEGSEITVEKKRTI